jgi:hypothetical protein
MSQYAFCTFCRLNYNQGRRHVYISSHQKLVRARLLKEQKVGSMDPYLYFYPDSLIICMLLSEVRILQKEMRNSNQMYLYTPRYMVYVL